MKISIALTTYNGELYIKKQLDSIIGQTVLPDEIIVVDDCSTDQTVHILNEYKNTIQLKGFQIVFSIFQNKKNTGVNKAFERALKLCTSTYVLLCDQDDIWNNRKIEILFDKIKIVECDQPAMVTSLVAFIDSNDVILSKESYINNLRKDTCGYASTLLSRQISFGCSMIINQKLIKHINSFPDYLLYDVYLGFVAAMIGVKYNLSIPLTYNRIHNQSYTECKLKKTRHNNYIISSYIDCKFPFFIPKNRLSNIPRIYEEYKKNISDKNIALLVDNLIKLRSRKNYFSICSSIFKIKELCIIISVH